MEQSSRISDNFRLKGQGIQFTIYLGKSFVVCDKLCRSDLIVSSAHASLQILETRTSRVKKDGSIRYSLPESQFCDYHWA